MTTMHVGFCSLVAALMLSSTAVMAAEAATGPVDQLFETPHLSSVEKGQRLSYRLQRTVSEPKLLGPPFSDDILVDIRDVTPEGQRNVDVHVFTGDRARDKREIDGLTGNPVLVFFLDRAVANFAMLGGGNRAYLKNKFRVALRTTAKTEKVSATFAGKTVEAQRITVIPYALDDKRDKMNGYENARFDIVVSSAVPGYLLELSSDISSPQDKAPRLEERIVLTGIGDAK
ncbi:MAG: hypothetical protein NW217_15365 [Hyphomicrobiaceae bacterium]|nr:hypothetical protein [Hyphomicrobiaceae bacterium]